MMTPSEAIAADPPNVWLTSFYGFNPAKWGLLGFSNEGQRNHFIKNTKPGALVVIYGHKSQAPVEQQGKVIGIQQVSHRVNHAKTYMDPTEWASKEANPASQGKWNLAVKATAAWKIAPESYVDIDDFADESYSLRRAQLIGSQGVRLTKSEVSKLNNLFWVRTSVFGETAIDYASPVLGREILHPSKAGPVSQQGYFVSEAEGPKQNYILILNGDIDSFLGRNADGKKIVKVGMSGSPLSRLSAFNAALPDGAFSWSLLRSNVLEGRDPYPNSSLGLVGENALKEALIKSGTSLGGEFFLASDEAIQAAWEGSCRQVKEYINAY